MQGTSAAEVPAAGSHQHAAWWPSGAAAAATRTQPAGSSPAAQPSYPQPQPASFNAAGAPAGGSQEGPGLVASYLQPPYPRASAPDLTASHLQPQPRNTAGYENSYTRGAANRPSGADGYIDRFTAAGSTTSAVPAADGSSEGMLTGANVRVPDGLAPGDGGGNDSAKTTSAQDATWDAVENIASATASGGLGTALQATPGVLGTSGYLQSRRYDATAAPGASGTATGSLQVLPGAAGMTVHTAVSLPPQADGAGMTVHTAVSLPAQQEAAYVTGYAAGARTALMPSTASPQRSWDVDGSQQRSVLDTYAPFTSEQLAARADGLTFSAVVPDGASQSAVRQFSRLIKSSSLHCAAMQRLPK